MPRPYLRGLFPSLLLTLLLVVPAFAGGGYNQWNGSGPFATGLGNRVITALAASADGKTLYAGTGSGTVFSYVYDSDNDGIADSTDNCPVVANADQLNTDGDALGDVCDDDDDNDTVLDGVDNCPLMVNADQMNTDGDVLGNVCDDDDDNDAVLDGTDNCPLIANAGQTDTDGDTLGDACDADDDNDMILDGSDNCMLVANADQLNTDGDALGDVCDPDDDNDAVLDGSDNCPLTSNADQVDSDGDMLGNVCDNCPAVANADQLDSDADGLGNVCDLEITVNPASIAFDYQGTVQLVLAPVAAGTTVTVEQILDVNGNGQVEATEPALRSFAVTDGMANANPNVLADSDGAADGSVTVVLNLRDARDLHHVPGNFLFWASDSSLLDTSSFAVTTTLGSQSVSGTITDSTNPVPGALVTLQGEGFSTTPYGTFADALGEYRIEVPVAGDYHVIAEDYTGQRVTAEADGNALVTVGAGQHVTNVNRTLTTGTVVISGNAGAAGVKIVAEGNAVYGQVLAQADGSYQLAVPAGTYEVRVQPTNHLGLHPSSKELMGQDGYRQSVNATSNVSGIDFTLGLVLTNVTGTVRDEFGVALEGMPVDAVNTSDPELPVAMAVTDASGNYALGLDVSNPWCVSVLGDKIWPQDLLSSYIVNYTTGISPTTGNDLTVYAANAWIVGVVKNSQGQPLAKVEVTAQTDNGALRTGGRTDMDGTYRLPARGGLTWNVDAITEDAGYAGVSSQSVTLANGQTATKDFVAAQLACAIPASLTIPTADADGSYTISWGTSVTTGVTYVLQEATRSDFGVGLQTVYTGAGTSVNLTGRSQNIYYYRVKAQKASYTDSGYKYASNGCAVPGTAAGVPGSLTILTADADGSYTVSWGTSATAGVTYMLEEATDPAFTSNLRSLNMGTATSANITGRSQNTTYYYRVKATKAGYVDSDYRVGSAGCAVPGSTTIGVPASLTVPTADADGGYTVSWGTSATAGVTYQLQEATNSTFSANQRTVYTGTATSYNITGRSQDVTYYYQVKAVKAGSTDSGYRYAYNGCAVPGSTTAGVPASLTVPAADADGSYTLSWGASATVGVIYQLQEATRSDFGAGLQAVYTGTGTSVTLTGRSPNVTYYYRVQALKAGLKDSGFRYASNGCAVPGSFTAGTPASMTVPTTDADGSYTVSWGTSATAGVTYMLEEATDPAFTSNLRSLNMGTATSANIAGRSQNTTYYYRVKATKAGYVDSDYRVGSAGCAVPGSTVAGVPASLTIPATDADGSYTISWGASVTAGVIYQLQEATRSDFGAGLQAVYTGTGTSVTLTGRSQNVTYYYRVRALKAGLKDSGFRYPGYGCAVPGTFTADVPGSMTVPTTDADGTFTVSWGATSTGGSYYQLQEARNSAFTTGLQTVYTGWSTSKTLTGRSPNTTYYYRVRSMKPGYKESAFRSGNNGCLVKP